MHSLIDSASERESFVGRTVGAMDAALRLRFQREWSSEQIESLFLDPGGVDPYTPRPPGHHPRGVTAALVLLNVCSICHASGATRVALRCQDAEKSESKILTVDLLTARRAASSESSERSLQPS